MNFSPNLATIATGGLNIISGYAANQSNIGLQRETNAANTELAREQMSFQREMSNTAHQREVKDLMAAGLNPNLSAGGNGSSTPSGAAPSLQAPQVNAIDFSQIIPQFAQMESLKQNQERINIDKANSAASIAKSLSETDLNKMRKILAQKGLIRADLEGEASGVIQKFMKYMKDKWNKTNPPGFSPLENYKKGMQKYDLEQSMP